MKIKKHKATFNELLGRVEFKEEHHFDIMFHTDWEDMKPGDRVSVASIFVNDAYIHTTFNKGVRVPNPDYDESKPSDYDNPQTFIVNQEYFMSDSDLAKHCTAIPEGF